MSNMSIGLIWIFNKQCDVPNDVLDLLTQGEKTIKAYRTVRDVAIFTNKRLIVRDAQGMSGKKVEVYSLPYGSINMWSSENAGRLLDLTSEVELWTRAGHIKIQLNKNIDIREFDQIIAKAVLGELN